MANQTDFIGFTDSGVGGVSVLAEALRLLPNERFVFLADQAFLPYGDQPTDKLSDRVLALGQWFHGFPCKALVLACNTATAAAIQGVRTHYPDWPVVGIEPAVKPAAMRSQTGRVGILATANTVASDRFNALVARFEGVAQVVSQPCVGLVELIEQHPLDHHAVQALLEPHVQVLLNQGVDVIVLGCTHYPFIRSQVQQMVGSEVQVIDTGQAVARQIKSRLAELALERPAQAHEGAGRQGQQVQKAVDRVLWRTTGCADALKQTVVGLLGDHWAGASFEAIHFTSQASCE